MATGNTKPHLTPGAYTLQVTDSGRVLFVSKRILTDSLVDLGDSNASRVIEGVRLFWTRKARYQAKGILYKRGVLLWGPPGSGKTATLSMLVDELVESGGIVLLVQLPAIATRALPVLRKIEPERPLIVVLEDIEEIVQNYGEHDLLALLDGEHQTDNVVNLATTNYPENLGSRIINRPSRFDEVHKIGMPSNEMRYNYLVHALGDEVEKFPVAKWVKDTNGLSVAHLKELVVAVTCLDQGYEAVLDRLKNMRYTPKSQMYDNAVGFTASGGQTPRKPNMTVAAVELEKETPCKCS
jgi:SpoVK/Ycf46/Vps4 family AAA+-type ATPase